MSEKEDFLTLLRKRNTAGHDTESNLKYPDNLRIQIISDGMEGELKIVDSDGNEVNSSEYIPAGAIGPLLKTLKDFNGNGEMSFSWGLTSISDGYLFSDFPFLSSFLENCRDLLVDHRGNHLDFKSDPHKVIFRLNIDNQSSGGAHMLKGNFYTGDNVIRAFLGERYVLTDNSVQCIHPIGDRFADLGAFITPFESRMTEQFLSLLFSYARNISLEYDERKVVEIAEPLSWIPTILIEKVAPDNSLCMLVSESVGNLPVEISDNFRLNYIVSLSEKSIYVRPIEKGNREKCIEIVRNAITENTSSRKEAKEIWSDGGHFVIPEDIASKFLYRSFPSLLNNFRVLGAEKLKSYKIVAAYPRLNLHLSSGINFLEGKANVEIGEESFTLRDLIAQYNRNRYVTLSDGNRAVIDDSYIKRLQRIFRDNPKKGDRVKISFFDLPEVMELLDDKDRQSKSFAPYREFYEGFNSLKGKKISTPGLKAKLRGYQKEGVKWIDYLYSSSIGGCLADDMGLGKTVQAIAMLTKSVPESKNPTLIVMPRSLLFNWETELRQFAPHLRVSTHYGQNRDLEKSLKSEVILTSYAVVRSDIEMLMKYEFDYIILDESQNIKNVDAQITKAVWLLKSKHRLAISGTPIENNLTELYSLFHFLNPDMFGSLKSFNEEYVVPISKQGDEETAKALRRKVFPFILRRLKKEVISDLPERTEQVLSVEMSPRQAALYEARRRYFEGEIQSTMSKSGVQKASFEMLQALLELRQIASIPEEKSDGIISSPKIDLLMEYMMAAIKNGHKVVAFFNFLTGIELTASRLDNEGVAYEIMTGATRDRKKVVEHFQEDENCKVMLMTVKTGGVGLNLVAADTVFIVEPWWNKAAEDQAINRLHRIGQKKSVNCYYLVTADTIEEKIRILQEKKSELVDSVISSDTGGKKLSADDISYLLS